MSTFSIWPIVILMTFCQQIHSYDYCKLEKNCTRGRHIACHPDQMIDKDKFGFRSTGKGSNLLVMAKAMRKTIVDMHNLKRNDVACGSGALKDNKGQTYPKASRMREVVWDQELEYLAARHAEQCVFAHDECRMSSKYRFTGQNLAMQISESKSVSVPKLVNIFINMWFNEYKDSSVKEIEAVGSTKTHKQIGHFTVMVNERVTKIGCAVAKCSKEFLFWRKQRRNPPQTTMHLFTCNYSYTNLKRKAMYKKGEPASKCGDFQATKSSQYKCLCSHNDNQPLRN